MRDAARCMSGSTAERRSATRAVEMLDARRHPLGAAAARRLSAPALRRHAPARDDRHGARLPPELLIADEPTTALDVTIQAQILDLLIDLRDELGMAIILITHDMGVVAEIADRVLVMYAGRIVEEAPVDALFDAPEHPYTRGLLDCVPSLEQDRARLAAIPGTLPDPARRPLGLPLRAALRLAHRRCRERYPAARRIGRPSHAPPASASTSGRRMTRRCSRPSALEQALRRAPAAVLGAAAGTLRAVDGVVLRYRAGRDARPRRRVRLRQVDARARC